MGKTAAQVSKLLSIGARLVVWGGLFGIVYILRSFFLLMFLMFVFSYIQSHVVKHLKGVISSRPVRVTIVGIMFLAIVVTISSFLVPYIKTQAVNTIKKTPEYIKTSDIHLLDLAEKSHIISMALDIKPPEIGEKKVELSENWSPDISPTVALVKGFVGQSSQDDSSSSVKFVTGKITNLGKGLLGVVSSFLLAMLFSFLIVLDLPHLAKATKDLSHTKIAFIYNEVAGGLTGFGKELGKAFEAQTIIAILNTTLTALGLWCLGITSQTAFLSMIVFFCSFIPIAGVFISSVPICLIGLQEGGISLFFLSILLITCIHLVEAYILNPKIYGQRLHLNPVIVLFILTTCGQVIGIWGLLLSLPICTYIFKTAIRYKHDAEAEKSIDDSSY